MRGILVILVYEFFLMKKTKESIEFKWQNKWEMLKKSTQFRFDVLLNKYRAKLDGDLEKRRLKHEKKINAYLNKKKLEYQRKMKNEIREYENKPPRQYKWWDPIKKPLQFAMELAQENAKLRDTNENGVGKCISCHEIKERKELAGWHRYTRRYTTMCLMKENINAQCHTCNYITWPMGSTVKKEQVNNEYDKSLVEKYGEKVLEKLKDSVRAYFQWQGKAYDLYKVVPKLIEENIKLWKTKKFYAPRRKWKELWTLHEEATLKK